MKKSKKNTPIDWNKFDAHTLTPEDYKEIPELTDEFFKHADVYVGGKLKRRGRPRKANKARPVTIRLNPDVERALRAKGRGWQTRLNRALMQMLEEHRL